MKYIKYIIKIMVGIILICSAVLFYAFKIEPYLLTTKDYTINNYHTNDGIKLIHLSDLEISSNYTEKQLDKIIKTVNKKEPDIIVFTGDLFSNYGKYRPVESVTEAFGNLTAKYGKYAIWGNNDYGGGAVQVYEDIMKKSGFKILRNSGENITLSNGSIVFIGGLDDSLFGNPDLDVTMKNKSENAKYRILLTHEPDIVDEIPDNAVDLILAGHTHGGQVSIKYVQERFGIHEKYIRGMFEPETLKNTLLYVNSGLGTSRIPVRFLVPPQILYFQIGIDS